MRIEDYSFGRIRIGGQNYTSDVIIYPDRVAKWWRKRGHEVGIEDLLEIAEARPEALVIGLGSSGCVRVLEEAKDYLETLGIELVAQNTGRACETYNKMEGRSVIAALHLTC